MGFVAAMGNPSRRGHRDRHAPSAVGAEARRVEARARIRDSRSLVDRSLCSGRG